MNNPIRQETKWGIVVGYKKCPAWLKICYYKAVNGICQECRCHFDKLTPHRLIRGNKGGLYTVAPINSPQGNVKPVCDKCHKKLHKGEPGCGSA